MYGICVKIFLLGIGTMYILKRYTMTKNTIDRQHTEQGQLVSTITSNNY